MIIGKNMTDLPLRILIAIGDINSDIEIAHRVEANNPETVDYFLSVFSRPMLEYIGKKIMCRTGVLTNGVLSYSPSVFGEYYEFISSPIIDGSPQWRKLSLFKGNARLITYVTTITTRHFIKMRNKELEDPLKKNAVSLQENPMIETLIMYNDFDGEALSNLTPELEWAWNNLSEKDREVLNVLVIDEVPPIEAFDTLIKYVERETSQSMLSKQQKQTIVALLKHRAKKHLLSFVSKYREIHNK